ncbi:hypothetical protein EEL32_07010 [Brevibacillus laterosporus]|uniref:Uncharacterized protein n=1 Tax=Brevibacillus laterosporus TaxID=1465 RepID=A0A502H6H2_BRELA|nr:hypothetical protein [Brevibacillus laterosporus]QDX95409.1 hypothetical protein EEL30_25900 [Brevibacillus laterosporus]TPG69315.1 hypothetical protein EEL31_12805 [Brevibacillus laterosporus]TPG89195.1 hypothetical protein EEL32_07010 [Brevibacillus laterosporus]
MSGHKCKSDEKIIYVTNDFLPQFISPTNIVPVVINLNSASNAFSIIFDPATDTITIIKSGIYLTQFSLQVSNIASPPPANPNPLLTFELLQNGGTIIPSQTSFNSNSLDTTYVTSTLLPQFFHRGDRIQLVLSAPNPLPAGTLLRIDFASITIFEID